MKQFRGEHLASLMAEQGMDTNDVARAIIRVMPTATITPSTVTKWIKNSSMTVKYIQPLVKVLNLKSADDLFTDTIQ